MLDKAMPVGVYAVFCSLVAVVLVRFFKVTEAVVGIYAIIVALGALALPLLVLRHRNTSCLAALYLSGASTRGDAEACRVLEYGGANSPSNKYSDSPCCN